MLNVLITRPEIQAEQLANALKQYDINGICFPVIKIIAPQNIDFLRQILSQVQKFDDLIFVSPNAVLQCFQYYPGLKKQQQRIIAIGRGTAKLLIEQGLPVDIFPQQANSEALLAMPEIMNMANKKIAIFAGENGKTLLNDVLQERGAFVTMAYTHRCIMPEYELPLTWRPIDIDISLCTSMNGLCNFRAIITHYQLDALLQKPLIVITEAMKIKAQQNGFKSAIIKANTHDIVNAVKGYLDQ